MPPQRRWVPEYGAICGVAVSDMRLLTVRQLQELDAYIASVKAAQLDAARPSNNM